MESTPTLERLNLSLEPHLVDALRPISPIISSELAESLRPYVSSTPPATIPYSIVASISQWARTTGRETLSSQSPPLDPQTYSMISLLAGTTTSPERKYGEYTPVKEPEELEAEKMRERKTITALVNALLSVLGSGFAAWWAADKTGWKDEWVCHILSFTCINKTSFVLAESSSWAFRRDCSGGGRGCALFHMGIAAFRSRFHTR